MAAPADVFRLPRTTYLVVLFLLLGALALAFGADASSDLQSKVSSGGSNEIHATWRIVFFAIPLMAIAFIARTATIVDASGIRIRALLGTRRLAWSAVRGLSVQGRSVYVVLADGAVRLPCVGVAQLSRVARASDGRLPKIADPTPKYAPQRRRR